jgi:hypothetical protein
LLPNLLKNLTKQGKDNNAHNARVAQENKVMLNLPRKRNCKIILQNRGAKKPNAQIVEVMPLQKMDQEQKDVISA